MRIMIPKSFISAYKELKMSGVYLLISDDKVIYVGSTINPSSRIYSHTISDKVFDRVGWIDCDNKTMYEVEAQKIIEHNPLLNVSLPSCDNLVTMNSCLLESKAIINNMVKELPIIFQRTNRSYVKESDFNRIMEVMAEAARNELFIINDEFMKDKECK